MEINVVTELQSVPMADAETARKRPGRRTGDSGTRAAILAAARDQFARMGYDGASLRMIAADAGVDTGLIRHFFGSKEELFAATLDIPEEIVTRMTEALAGDPDRLGERLIRTYLSLWEDPVSAEPFLAIVRSAVSSDRAADHLRAIISARVLGTAAPALTQDNSDVRAALAGSQLVGIALARYVIRVEPLASLDRDTLVALCAPAIQRYLTGPLPLPPTPEVTG